MGRQQRRATAHNHINQFLAPLNAVTGAPSQKELQNQFRAKVKTKTETKNRRRYVGRRRRLCEEKLWRIPKVNEPLNDRSEDIAEAAAKDGHLWL